jgi:hypothetical protein
MCVALEIDMNPNSRRVFWCLIIVPLVAASFTICLAQEPKPKTETEIRALIKTSLAKDYRVTDEANAMLSKLSVRDVRALTAILRKGATCERMKAAQLMVDLNKENKNLIPILIELSTGGSASSTEEDLLCRRGATFLLAFSTEGIRVLTGMLKDGKNLFIRQSAIFAFDELTETSNYPEGSLEAMKAAIPVIARSGKLDDQVMMDMSDEVLWQIVRHGGKDMSKIAKKYVGDMK